jgi:hypothetical protein
MALKPLSEIISKFRSIINETIPGNTHFSDENQLAEWCSEAIRFIITRLEQMPVTWSSITSALGDIALDDTTLLVNEAYILNPDTGKYDELKVVDYSNLKYISPTWLSDEANTPKYLARNGNFLVSLYPQPSTKYVGQNIKLAGIVFNATVTVGGNLPQMSKNVYDWIPHHMAHNAFQQLGFSDKSVSELVLVQGLIKSAKSLTTKFSEQSEQWAITEDNDC